jgi:tetratricopeptide (TPR) repeat protein
MSMIGVPLRPVKVARSRTAPALLGLILLACSPGLSVRTDLESNPVEVLDKSPRVYHITFADFADSLRTERARAYLTSTITDVLPPDSLEMSDPSDAGRARTEYAKARKRLGAGLPEVAMMHLERAVELDPDYPRPYILMGKIMMSERRVGEAARVYAGLLSIDRTNSDALVGLGRCYMLLGDYERARRALIDAVIFDRVNLNAWTTLVMLGGVAGFQVADRDARELARVRKRRGRHYDLVIDSSLRDCPVQTTAWVVFASQRAVWRYEGKHRLRTGETHYEPTFEEDVDCYMALVAAWKVLAVRDSTVCDHAYLDHLGRVADDGLLVPHVLFDYVCLKSPTVARRFTGEIIDGMRRYVENHVLVESG